MRRLIVCCDGTWKKAEDDAPTNVVRMARAIAPVAADGTSQIVYYDSGVGTGGLMVRLTGGVMGTGISENIKDAYRFLVHNFVPADKDGRPDEIYFFGFSRGAFTVRSLAGMVRACGILHPEHADQIDEAWDVYRIYDPDKKADNPEKKAFRERYAYRVGEKFIPPIKFVGVWDSVGSLGVPVGRIIGTISRARNGFHDVALSSCVELGYHALACDEGRYTFEPSLWTEKPGDGQKIEQTWFPGAHSDVGGGYADAGLADVTLEWMIERARAAGLEMFDPYIRRTVRPNLEKVPEDSRWLRFLPGNIRDVGRYPACKETVYRNGAGFPRVAPGLKDWMSRPVRKSGAFENPELPLLKRPPIVRAMRWICGSDDVHRTKPGPIEGVLRRGFDWWRRRRRRLRDERAQARFSSSTVISPRTPSRDGGPQ